MSINRSKNQAKRSEQYILNASYDQDVDLLAFEMMGFDPLADSGNGAMRRVTTNAMGEYGTNNVEEIGAITYIGKEDPAGSWFIQKVDTSSGTSIRYASVKNNPSTTSYTTAWTNRASLTYDTYGIAF